MISSFLFGRFLCIVLGLARAALRAAQPKAQASATIAMSKATNSQSPVMRPVSMLRGTVRAFTIGTATNRAAAHDRLSTHARRCGRKQAQKRTPAHARNRLLISYSARSDMAMGSSRLARK